MTGRHPTFRAAANAARAIARWRVEQRLTANQADVVIQVFAAAAISAADLSRQVGITTASMSRLLAGLEDEGWIVRAADPADARRSIVQASKRLAVAIESLLAELLAAPADEQPIWASVEDGL
jgi:DNA-binding MarR family transcriptional regulator